MKQPRHTLFLRRLLSALFALSVASIATAQNLTTPNSDSNAATAGVTTTEGVLKKNSSTVNIVPGYPTQAIDYNKEISNARAVRVSEPERYVDLQARIAKLKSAAPVCPNAYHLAKAQAWLNFARDQFHESAWQKNIQETTYAEAERLVVALETGRDPGMGTPLVSDAQKIRPDLWAMAEKIKQDSKGQLCCAQRDTAFCEVQLVWSGHALTNLGGWRRANPFIKMAEDLCQTARQTQCAMEPTPVPVALAAPLAAAVVSLPVSQPAYEKITLAAETLFMHGQSAVDQMLPEGRAKLNELAVRLKLLRSVEKIIVNGHADITNATGDKNYNDNLSLARANTVRSYLTTIGVDMSNAVINSAGDREPIKIDCFIPKGSNGVTFGSASKQAMQAYYLCLQPNRRVEVELFGKIEK
jgi:outer membrane protein OmpA-like peptidoglycan-associated protein